MRAADNVLAIGLDACDLSFIHSRKARLPLLAKLTEAKFFCEPAAPKALTGSVWPSFYTSSHPGRHGIYQHIVWDAQRMRLRLIEPDWCAFRPFWADLEDRGRNVILLDVPYTFPVFLKRGVETRIGARMDKRDRLPRTAATSIPSCVHLDQARSAARRR